MKKLFLILGLSLVIGGCANWVGPCTALADQHDYVIDNNPGATFRTDLNNALKSIVTNNSGASEPSTTYANMWWYDTSTGKLKRRNNANTAWVQDTAIQIASAGGTANTITADFDPDISLADKTLVAVVASAASSSTTPSFAPDGLGAHTITKEGGSALLAGDIPAAGFVMLLEYNLSNTRWELLNPSSKPYTDTKVSKTTAGEINTMTEKTTLADNDLILIEDSADSYSKKKAKKSSLAAVSGFQVFTSSGTFTAPTGVTKVYITACGAGGGSGGGNCDIANGTSGGAGSGAWVVNYPYTVTGGNNYTVTLNNGGTHGTCNTAGSDGGTTVFDSLTLQGGKGSSSSSNSSGARVGAAGGSKSSSYTAYIGDSCDGGTSIASTSGGVGGSTPFGKGGDGGHPGASTGGNGATNSGAGAGGAGPDQGSIGGDGAKGIVIVEW